MPRPGFETLLDALQHRVRETPQATAFSFLKADGDRRAGLSYEELGRRCRALAAVLQEKGLAGERSLLLFPPGLDFVKAFYACVLAGVVPVPAYPPDPRRLNRTLPRVQAIIADCDASCVLTTTALKTFSRLLFPRDPALRSLEWLATGRLERGSPEGWREPQPDGGSIALLQYTSGSTGAPRGVAITHTNLMMNQEMMRLTCASDERSVILSWVPFYHDLGLIGGVVYPVYTGAESILMSPLDFVRSPLSWLRAVTRYRATMSAGPNFAFEMCVRKSTEQDREGLDLSSWDMALVGSEPISAETLERFAAAFAPHGFRPTSFFQGYGLAETVLSVASGRIGVPHKTLKVNKKELQENRLALDEGEGAAEIVSCGEPLPGQTVEIVDPERCVKLPALTIGEIWVRGENVARGYWNRPDETRAAFEAFLEDGGEGPFLRTGDLGFIFEGELYVTGRVKDLIILRGRNHYPQDIEACVAAAHPALRPGCAAAFSVGLESGEALVVLQEMRDRAARKWKPREVIHAIRRTLLQDEELRPRVVALLEARTLPKTSSGKIRRAECRRAFLHDELKVIDVDTREEDEREASLVSLEELAAYPPDSREAALRASLRRFLAERLGLPEEGVEMARPVLESGLDSLAIMGLSHEVESRFGVELEMDLLLQGASFDEIATHVLERSRLREADVRDP